MDVQPVWTALYPLLFQFLLQTFTVSADSSCPNAPNPLRFTNKSTGGFNPTYTWDFNDGNTSNAVSPIYAYTTVGSYNVVLKMNDAYGCTSISSPQNIFVGTPQASFTMSGNFSTCPPFNDTFAFKGSYAVSYDWDFTDGNGSIAKNPSNLFANAGNYNPYLIVTSHGGCTVPICSSKCNSSGTVTHTYLFSYCRL